MAELTGSLSNFDLAALVRFLAGLGKSGDLLVSREHWIGQLAVDHGRLIAAAVVDESGMPALEFIAAVMNSGDFEFSEGPPTLAPNFQVQTDALAELDQLAANAPHAPISHLLPPTIVPRVIDLPDVGDANITLGRRSIYVLRDVDGLRTVRDIAAQHGLLRTLRALDQLHQLDLIVFDPGQPPAYDDRSGAAPRLAVSPGIGSQHPASAVAENPSASPPCARPAPALLDRVRTWSTRLARGRARSMLQEVAQAVVLTGVLIFGIRTMVQNFRVEGISMLPTFEGGQVLVINRAAYFHVEASPIAKVLPTTHQGSISFIFGGPQRGDIAVFRAPPQPDANYIKRIIGLPGDSVQIHEGHVLINGQPMDEPYIDFPATYEFPPDHQPISVPDGSYFVLGDNRPDSFDSHLGWFVPVDNLIGRAWLRYWPPGELGVVQAGRPMQATSATRPS
jgi:signal peptidase I